MSIAKPFAMPFEKHFAKQRKRRRTTGVVIGGTKMRRAEPCVGERHCERRCEQWVRCQNE